MKKEYRVRKNEEFNAIIAKRRSVASGRFVIYSRKKELEHCRVGISVSKKLGNAVERNRCKRIIRAAYRNVSPLIKGNWDFIFVSRTKTKYLKSTDIEKILTEILQKAGAV